MLPADPRTETKPKCLVTQAVTLSTESENKPEGCTLYDLFHISSRSLLLYFTHVLVQDRLGNLKTNKFVFQHTESEKH